MNYVMYKLLLECDIVPFHRGIVPQNVSDQATVPSWFSAHGVSMGDAGY